MLVRFENCKSYTPNMTEVDLTGHTVLLSFPFAPSSLYVSSYNAVFALTSGEKVNNFLDVFSINAKKRRGTLRQGQRGPWWPAVGLVQVVEKVQPDVAVL